MKAEARLAARREALIAQCAQQREDAAGEVAALLHPVSQGYLGNLKLPLAIAGVVLGLVASRRGRGMPILTAGLSLWKLAGSVLSVLRR